MSKSSPASARKLRSGFSREQEAKEIVNDPSRHLDFMDEYEELDPAVIFVTWSPLPDEQLVAAVATGLLPQSLGVLVRLGIKAPNVATIEVISQTNKGWGGAYAKMTADCDKYHKDRQTTLGLSDFEQYAYSVMMGERSRRIGECERKEREAKAAYDKVIESCKVVRAEAENFIQPWDAFRKIQKSNYESKMPNYVDLASKVAIARTEDEAILAKVKLSNATNAAASAARKAALPTPDATIAHAISVQGRFQGQTGMIHVAKLNQMKPVEEARRLKESGLRAMP